MPIALTETRKGRVLAAGPIHDVLTTRLVSEAFAYPIQIEYRDHRWQARADRTLRSQECIGR